MCGIAGFIGGGSRQVAEAMQLSLKHRGPDAGGVKIFGNTGLVHRRLSIIDLSEEGAQPMSTLDGRYTIVYNGEIYNYHALRKQYLANYTLRSETDTEVILKLFAKLGVAALDKLEGMYALAVYDRYEEILYLHRDRIGKKPLFYTQLPNKTFIFGSELKALKQHPSFKGKINQDAVFQYLLYEYIPAPRTIYSGVNKLMPGEILTIYQEKVVSSFVSSIVYENAIPTNPLPDLGELLQSAISKRLVADVPVGIFLSGGLDSSLVAAIAQSQAKQPIKTFSIGFEDESFNEQSAAQTVANHIGSEHYQATLSNSDIVRLLSRLPEVLDEPMADSSIIPTLLVSEHARKQVTVCLSGDGADELFLGYGTFFAHRIANKYQKLPLAVRKGFFATANQLSVSHQYMSFDFKLKRFLKGCLSKPQYRNTLWLSAIEPEILSALSRRELNKDMLYGPIIQWHQGTTSVWQGIKQEYLRGYLIDDILVKTDRASMSYGLEVRSPFLDEQLMAYVLKLDDSWKLRGRVGKYALKKLAESKLPKDIIYRKKQGFNFPIGAMIRDELKGEFESTLLEGGLMQLELFNRDIIEKLLQEHVEGKEDHRKALWSLYVLGKWVERWC
ncbi:MAG: asparagine synthase (glutamine-hydrolyzing) [Candidatus Pacebacteria bacterium CG_4_10_14_0_2_um_filter_40_20]|nr:MAG: asparagine synthase (glutamine-hydrolyzing) [Candidatus Pacebacteria bacterium CG_4_10_14_0_2_um_filter_40_20]